MGGGEFFSFDGMLCTGILKCLVGTWIGQASSCKAIAKQVAHGNLTMQNLVCSSPPSYSSVEELSYLLHWTLCDVFTVKYC